MEENFSDCLETKTIFLAFLTINQNTVINIANEFQKTWDDLNRNNNNEFEFPIFKIESNDSSFGTYNKDDFINRLKRSFAKINFIEMVIQPRRPNSKSMEYINIKISAQTTWREKDIANSITIQGSDDKWVRGLADIFYSLLDDRKNKNKFIYTQWFRAIIQLTAVSFILFFSIKASFYGVKFFPNLKDQWPIVLAVLLILSNLWSFFQITLLNLITQWKPVIGFGEIKDNRLKFNFFLTIVGGLLTWTTIELIKFLIKFA